MIFDIFFRIIFSLYFLLTIFLFVFCPSVAFATGPEEVIDHDGNVEYIGKDPYAYYNEPMKVGTSNNVTSQDVIKTQGDSYKSNPPFEKD
jgi:hypothetical protein